MLNFTKGRARAMELDFSNKTVFNGSRDFSY